jgi:hypothetical protein
VRAQWAGCSNRPPEAARDSALRLTMQDAIGLAEIGEDEIIFAGKCR